MSQQVQSKPKLVIVGKEALKELDASGQRDQILGSFDTILPTQVAAMEQNQLGRMISKDGPLTPQKFMEMYNTLRDQFPQGGDHGVTEEQIRTVVMHSAGLFGPDARMVGLPPVLQPHAQLLALQQGGPERMGFGEVYKSTSDFLGDPSLGLTEKEQQTGRSGISKEQSKWKITKMARSAGKKLARVKDDSAGVERQWDQSRTKISLQQQEQGLDVQPMNTDYMRYEGYYNKLATLGMDDSSPVKQQALEHFAQRRYDGLMQEENDEIGRQVQKLDELGYKPIDVVGKEKEMAEAGSEFRSFQIDPNISKRMLVQEQLQDEDTPNSKKQKMVQEIMDRSKTQQGVYQHTNLEAGAQGMVMFNTGLGKKIDKMCTTISQKLFPSRKLEQTL